MSVEAVSVAIGEPVAAVNPGGRVSGTPFVSTPRLPGLDTAPCDARPAPAARARPSTARMISDFGGAELRRPKPLPAPLARYARDRVEEVIKRCVVVDIGSVTSEAKQDARATGDDVAPSARFASVHRVGTRCGTHALAAMNALSMHARRQSIRYASRSRQSRSRCAPWQMPTFWQLRSRGLQTTPDPHPVSGGDISYWMSVRTTNRMPDNAAHVGTGRLPAELRSGRRQPWPGVQPQRNGDDRIRHSP